MLKKMQKIMSLSMLSFILCFAGLNIANATTEGTGIIIDAKPTVSQELVEKAVSSWPWYLTRASGIIAALALVLLMLSGMGFITGSTYRFLEPITGWATHRALGIIFSIAVLIHVGALYFDTFVPFNFSELLIPFKSNYKLVTILGINFGSFYVALGVIALYLLGLIILTSLFWIDKKPKTWKIIHILSYIVMLFVFIHALFLGTDLAHGPLRSLWLVIGALILWMALTRLWRVNTI